MWIGTCISLGAVTVEGYYTVGPTTASAFAVTEGCRDAIAAGQLQKQQAATLRGKTGWANCHTGGRCGRIGVEVLKRTARKHINIYNSIELSPTFACLYT